jgi:aarF domain-containing kinase
MSAQAMVSALRRRPWMSLGAATLGCTTVAAYAVEYSTEHFSDKELPRVYKREALQRYWRGRPVTAVKRLFEVTSAIGPRVGSYVWDFVLFRPADINDQERLQSQHAAELRKTLTRLGPAFVKAGQQLSIRPDLVPPAVLQELQKLCDAVEPVPDDVALNVLREELQCDKLTDIFEGIHLVASASLGQVYKAKVCGTGEEVAIKVQRPNMLKSFSLDLYLLQKYGVILDAFVTTFTHQAPFHKELFDNFSQGSYSELDYENEAANQIRFKEEFSKRRCKVKIPAVYEEYTTQRVLTTEWIDGVKLADATQKQIRKLIPVGVTLFLTQLLDIGAFHAGKSFV